MPWGTREMIYFRLKVSGVVYESEYRSRNLLENPWCEFSPRLISIAECAMGVSNPTPPPVLEVACLHCGAIGETMFEAIPCTCFKVCKQHAMKAATGGRCKICKEMYTGFKKL